jgi:hypothetical protein
MSSPASFTRRLTRALATHAARTLPLEHSPWGEAMRRETDYIASDRAALAFAFGCLLSAYSTRFSNMRTGNLRPARSLLVLEMLLCFLPLTGIFIAALLHVFASAAHPPPILGALLAASALGPAGLLVVLAPALGRARGPVPLIALAVLSAVTITAFATGILPAPTWRDAVLCVLLPLAGVAHLAALTRTPSAASLQTG